MLNIPRQQCQEPQSLIKLLQSNETRDPKMLFLAVVETNEKRHSDSWFSLTIDHVCYPLEMNLKRLVVDLTQLDDDVHCAPQVNLRHSDISDLNSCLFSGKIKDC